MVVELGRAAQLCFVAHTVDEEFRLFGDAHHAYVVGVDFGFACAGGWSSCLHGGVLGEASLGLALVAAGAHVHFAVAGFEDRFLDQLDDLNSILP